MYISTAITMRLKDKILHILTTEGISEKQFADTLKTDVSWVYKLIRGDVKKIQHRTIKKINNAYPNYSVQWLKESESHKDGSDQERQVLQKFDKIQLKEVAYYVVTNEA